MSPYPPHILEPIRLEIACSYLQHEERKILSDVREQTVWKAIDSSLAQLPDRLAEDDLIRDFWNLLHGISMGYKLKSMIGWLTSLDIVWEYQPEIGLESIEFNPMDGIGMEAVAEGAVTAAQVQAWYQRKEHLDQRKQAQKHNQDCRSNSASRDHFPLILLKRAGATKMAPLDGSGRVIQAVVTAESAVKAYLGTQTVPGPLKEAWVPTSTMMDLVYAHRVDPETTRSFAGTIVSMIRYSQAGRWEFFNRAIDNGNSFDTKLGRSVKRRLSRLNG